jgi:hypothetical protein
MDKDLVMETITRLRDALKDATFQNAYLVLKNNELTLENSFMTPTQLEILTKIKAEQAPRYMNQRTDPQCIAGKLNDGTPIFKKIDLPPQHCSILPSNEDLFREVKEVLITKGKKREEPSPDSLRLPRQQRKKDDGTLLSPDWPVGQLLARVLPVPACYLLPRYKIRRNDLVQGGYWQQGNCQGFALMIRTTTRTRT